VARTSRGGKETPLECRPVRGATQPCVLPGASSDGTAGSGENARFAHAPIRRRRSPVFTTTSFPRRNVRMSDNWAGLLASGSNYLLHLPAAGLGRMGRLRLSRQVARSGFRRFRPRLQRRDRDGFTPSSLFFSPAPSRWRHPGLCPNSARPNSNAAILSPPARNATELSANFSVQPSHEIIGEPPG
jgi:hypothetical protein